MKKLLILSLVALFGAAMVRAEASRAELVNRVESCEAILQEFQLRRETAIPPEQFHRAKAIIILNQFKAGFLLGVKDGYGVIIVRKPGGQWSLPVLLTAGEASIGFQIGANSIQSVFLVYDESLPRQLFNHRFNLGVDAKAVAGPHAGEHEHMNKELLNAPMHAYIKNIGLFAGATVKAGHISRDDKSNFLLYNTKYTMPELLYSDWVPPPPEVQPLMTLVQRLGQ